MKHQSRAVNEIRRMYNRMWHQTQEALNTLLNEESEKMTEPQRNKVIVFQMLATFYIKYVQIFRDMEDVYDQIVHPQKRMLIRKILDGVMGRILELKNEMVELEMTEFHYFDDILQDLKLTPKFSVKRLAWEEAVNLIQTAESTTGPPQGNADEADLPPELRAKEIKLLANRQADPALAALQIQKVRTWGCLGFGGQATASSLVAELYPEPYL
ncbi:hypothetical protein STEG23_026394 [Scotinomys teguina]